MKSIALAVRIQSACRFEAGHQDVVGQGRPAFKVSKVGEDGEGFEEDQVAHGGEAMANDEWRMANGNNRMTNRLFG